MTSSSVTTRPPRAARSPPASLWESGGAGHLGLPFRPERLFSAIVAAADSLLLRLPLAMKHRALLVPLCLLTAFQSTSAQRPRIVGGEAASAGQYPWMAGLLNKDEPDAFLAQDCGGALIHPHWVVTAAHCVEFRDPADIQVIVGATDLTAPGLQRRNVAEVIMHPDYRPWANDHDIALVLLAEPVTGIAPLEVINDPALAAAGVTGRSLGWGALDNTADPQFPNGLQAVELPVVDTEIANQPDWLNGSVTPNMFAAGYEDGGKDTCGGDSGGPFVVWGPAGQWMLAGVINWADECAVAKKPGVYCRVSRYRHWLQSIVWPDFYKWETNAAINTDDGPDVDGDGASQWLEYAMGRDPRVVDTGLPLPGFTLFESQPHATLSVKRPAGGGSLSWGLEGSTDLTAWSPLDPAMQLTSPPQNVLGEPGMETVTWRGVPAQNGRSFIRAVIKPSTQYAASPRTLAYPGFVPHALHTLEAPVAGFHTRDYELTGLVTGRKTYVTLRSDTFDAVLRIVNAATGTVLQSSSANTAGDADEKLFITPAAGTRYLARITTAAAGELGGFQLSVYDGSPATFAAGNTRPGSLAVTDSLDELSPGLTIFKDDYLFQPSTSGVITLTLSATAYDPVVSIIDAETGGLINYSFGSAGVGTALLTWKPEAIRDYYIQASSSAERGTGSYTLRAANTAAISIGGTVNGTIASTDGLDPYYVQSSNYQYYADDYVITGKSEGELLTVNMASFAFASSLEILNAATGESITNDYGETPATPLSLRFIAEAGVSYIIRASTSDELETGSYTLSVRRG